MGREAISQPFSYDVDLVVTETEGLDAADVAGATVSLVFERDGLDARTVHGMVTSFVDLLPDTEARAQLLPHPRRPALLARLGFIHTQEVFLNLSVPDIIKQKLGLVNLGGPDFDLRLMDKYLPREIVVQYRETDLAFVSRLAEHLGVSYYFDHESGVDKLVFTDNMGTFGHLDHLPTMHFRTRGDRTDVFPPRKSEHNLFPANYAVLDYDYRAPHLELTSTFEHHAGYAGGVAEYGSHHRTPGEGERLAPRARRGRATPSTASSGARAISSSSPRARSSSWRGTRASTIRSS